MKNLIFAVIVLLGSSNVFGASKAYADVTCVAKNIKTGETDVLWNIHEENKFSRDRSTTDYLGELDGLVFRAFVQKNHEQVSLAVNLDLDRDGDGHRVVESTATFSGNKNRMITITFFSPVNGDPYRLSCSK